MKAHVLLILYLSMSLGTYAQWRQDFEFPSYNADQVWTGDVNYWVQDQGWLRSNGPAVSGTCIAIQRQVTIGDTLELRFLARLLLATSSNNYLEVTLSDSLNNQSLIIRLGGTPDEVSLYLRRGSKDSLLIDGLDKRLNSSSSNLIAVRLRKFGEQLILSVGPNGDTSLWVTEGIGSTGVFIPKSLSIKACYSASNATRFSIDAISIDLPWYDTLVPSILNVYDLDSLNWRILFSETMDTGKGLCKDALSQSLDFVWLDQKTIKIEVPRSNSLPIGFFNFMDYSGNLLADTFFNLETGFSNFRDIQFTEIMSDPTPSQGLAEVEWLELYNASKRSIELKDFRISDISSEHVFPFYSFAPGSYLILCSPGNCVLMTGYGPCLELPVSASFLNNTGDIIVLKNRQGDTVERVAYSNLWHDNTLKKGGGFSLEKQDPKNPCLSDSLNYVSTASSIGGSPGKLNSRDQRFIDTLPPKLVSVQVSGPLRLLFTLTEEVNESVLRLLFEGDTFFVIKRNGFVYEVRLKTALPDNAGKVFTGVLLNLKDCSGNITSHLQCQFRYAIPAIPAAHELVFTELLFLPTKTQKPFIELYNTGILALSISGSKVKMEGKEFFLQNAILYPGESLIICKPSDTLFFSGLKYQALSGFPVPNKHSGKISLFNIMGKLMDVMDYSDTLFPDFPQKSGGYSIERRDVSRNCSTKDDWLPSAFPGGSPGNMVFSVIQSPEIVTRLQQIYPEDKCTFRCRFSGPLNEGVPELRLLDAWGSMLSWELAGDDFRSWRLKWSDSLLEHTNYRIQLSDLYTCNGDGIGQQELEFRLPVKTGAIRINEILFDPIGELPDYVELYNAGEEAIDLKGKRLANLKDGQVPDQQVEICESGYLLMPNSYVVLTLEQHQLANQYGYYFEENVLILPSLPTFPNSTGSVMILSSAGEPLDSFHYKNTMHSLLLVEKEGVSLERIDPKRVGEQSGNWTSAAADVHFGTPGRQNSQYRTAPDEQKKHWQFYSQSFSPDGDGFEDVAILSYTGLEPGCSLNIVVYSLSAIPVYQWANNQPCGTSGTMLWEGYDNQQQMVPDGPYLIEVVWTNPKGDSKRERLVLVKASQLRLITIFLL